MATFDLSDYGTVIIEDLTINGEIIKSIPSGLPVGTIIPWQDVSTIPNGWSLCDGSGTYTDLGGQTKTIPDLRSRFIIGYDSRDTSFNIDTSGSSFIYREADSDSHDPRNAFALGDVNDENNSTTEYERVYYSLAYIICIANPFTNSTGDKTITGNIIANNGYFSESVTASNIVSSTYNVVGSFSAGRDTDSTSHLGRTAIGYNGTTTDFATLSHVDQNTSTNYGFGQTSDGSTHINAASDAKISMRIANQEKIIINSDGNLGIGASNPVNKLDISGSMAIGSGYAGLSTAPTDGLIVQGNIGIGTSTPTKNLTINASNPVLQLCNSSSGSGADDGLQISTSTSGAVINNKENGNIEFQANGNTCLTFASNGYVGIGTNSPINNLDIAGNLTIGSGYATTYAGPSNGVLVEGNVGIGTATPSVPLEVNGEIRGYGVCIVGTIIMWSGTVSSSSPQDVNGTVHTNWKICDGSNGTPDLRNRFIVGAYSNSDIGNTGGTNSVTLTASNLPNHSHGITLYMADDFHWNTNGTNYAIGTDNYSATSGASTTATGSGTAIDNRPAYYALAFIMRVS